MKKITGDCYVDGCNKAMWSRGLCRTHYSRWRRHGDPTIKLKADKNSHIGKTCTVEGCVNPQWMKTFCRTHYWRNNNFGRFHVIRRVSGEGTIDGNGYRLMTEDGNRKAEHIILAEKALGKPLPNRAVVHHFNGKKTDNHTPFNLIICPDQAYHMLLHKREKELKSFGKCLSTNYGYKGQMPVASEDFKKLILSKLNSRL